MGIDWNDVEYVFHVLHMDLDSKPPEVDGLDHHIPSISEAI